MIFLSAVTESVAVKGYEKKRKTGQFFNEYQFLLKTISRVYPDAVPVLVVFEGNYQKYKLKDHNKNLLIFDWRKKFNPDLGIDTNKLYAVKEIIKLMDETIILLDTDCFIVKNFDEYIFDDKVDITSVTRGKINFNGVRQDIIFAVNIFNNKNRYVLFNFIDKIIEYGRIRAVKTGDNWNNIQPGFTACYLKYKIDLSINMKTLESNCGTVAVNDESSIRVKIVPQYVLAYPIQKEKYYDQTCIIHYKNHPLRKDNLLKLFFDWGNLPKLFPAKGKFSKGLYI